MHIIQKIQFFYPVFLRKKYIKMRKNRLTNTRICDTIYTEVKRRGPQKRRFEIMLILAIVALVISLFLAFGYGIFAAYENTRLDKMPEWLEKTYDFMFGWL